MKKAISFLVLVSTIIWSSGLPWAPVVFAAAPRVSFVEYINPTLFKVRFDQLMNPATISIGSFTLSTGAVGDTETITAIATATESGVTVANVVAAGAKASPHSPDWIRVATSGANAPQNAGAENNADGNMIGLMMTPGAIVISELKLSGGTATDEFVEIYNKTGSAVDVVGWKLTLLAADGTPTDLVTFTGASAPTMQGKTSIPAGGFRLIGPTGIANADATYTASGNGLDTNNTVILYRDAGGGIFRAEDMVGCGTAVVREGMATAVCPLANTSLERKVSPASTAALLNASTTPAGTESSWGNNYDTNSNNFDFVTQTGTGVNPQHSTSTAEVPGGGGGGYQNQPPNINHMPLFQVISGQGAMTTGMFADPETPAQGLTAQMIYSLPPHTTWNTLTGQYQSGQDFNFTIPSSASGSGTGVAFKYYLKVTDGNSVSRCRWDMALGNGGFGECGASDATAKTGAFTVNSVSSAGMTNSIKGRVMSGATGLDNAQVRLMGAGLNFSATSATDGATTGAFTFTNIPSGMFRLEASAPGYMMGWLDGIVSKAAGAAYVDNTISLTSGSSGGQGGDTASPRVIWSAPTDQMMSAPTRIDIPATGEIQAPMMIGFSKDMDATTIIGANIKVYPMAAAGLGTALSSISIAYQPQSSSVTLTDRSNRQVQMGPDRKAILYSATPLSPNIQYAIDLTNAVKDSAGNALQGNKSGGGHTISFTTGGDFSNYTQNQMTTSMTNFVSGSSGGGQFTPPYVTGSQPTNGARNVPTNAKITVNFSQPMDSVGINATNSTGTYLKLYDTNVGGSGQYVTVESIVLDNTTKQMATITVGGSGLTASHSNYAIRVLGGAKSATGMTMAMPGQEGTVMYQADFSTGSGTDLTAPTVIGNTLQTYTAAASCSVNLCVTGVPTNLGTLQISFSKDMDASTINSSNITLANGTTAMAATISYDPLARTMKIVPNTVLYTLTTYTLTVGIGVRAMNGTALSAAYIISFTTNSAVDSTGPTVMMANADDYKMAITFSEPMLASKATETANWAASVLNPTNYVLYVNSSPPPFTEGTNTAKYFTNNNLATAIDAASGGPLTFRYDAAYNTAIIEGLKLLDTSLTIKGGFNVWVKNVKDISGNVIQDSVKPANVNDFGANAAGGPVNNASSTFGNIGPGGGGMSGPPPTAALSGGAMQVTAFGGKDPGMMGFKPIGVWPVNMLAGQESMYMIDIPLSQAIPASGQIILTFPPGFDVTNAADADPNKLWAHKDLNGPGTGTVVIASVAANATARTVTITLGAVATQANDFLHLEIDRIKNTTTANDGDMSKGITMGSGYQADIYTKTPTASGARTLETLKSMPFFIKSAGTASLTGSITFKDASNNNTNVTLANLPLYLMSPMTGPLKTLVSLSNEATKTYTFSNIPTGWYMLGTEPLQTIGATDYYVDLTPMPYGVEVAAGTNTKNLVFQAQAAANKPNLTVYITGTFTNESIDIFSGGPSGFSVKTVSLNGTFTNASPSTQTVYLPSTGTWMVGMGPAMPRGPMQSGPPPMPNWMPPKPIEVQASGTGPGWTWKDNDGAADLDTTAADGKITFGVISANRTINGHIYGPTGTTGIQNAHVSAYNPFGGMGSFAESGADGSFQLKVTDGSYKVHAFIPGMPGSPEISVEVKTVSGTTTIYANGVATTDVIIRTQNPTSLYTISGKVTDSTNVVKDASVYARRTDGPGNVGGKTDSMGKYILYVQAGTWAVGAFLPQYGNLAEQTVTITTASQADIDFAPAIGTTFRTVKDRIFKDVNSDGDFDQGTDTPLANVHVDFDKTNYHNTAMTDANGQYTILVPDGSYTLTAWSPDAGKAPPQTSVISANVNLTGAADLPVPDTRTVTINFIDALAAPVTLSDVYVQMDKLGSQDVSNETNRDNVSSLTLPVPSGTGYEYALDIDIPGVADTSLTMAGGGGTTINAQQIIAGGAAEMYTVVVDGDGNETINVTVPTLYTVSGQAQDNSNNPLPDALVNIKKGGTSDIALAVKTDASGNYSVQLPASGATPYLFQIDKGGYVDTGLSVVVTGVKTQNLDANKANLTVSGQIRIGSSGVESAKVFAKELGGGFASTETDSAGNYVLPVTAGNWKISASSDDYQEKEYQNGFGQDIVVSLSASNQEGININLTTQKTGLADMNNADVTPSSGATFEHGSAGLELIAPQNAIAASQSTYQIEDYEVANITSSPTAKTIGGEAIQLSAYEPSGSSMIPKNTFADEVTIEKQYTKAELVAEGIDTFSEVEAVKMSYFDESASNWEPVLTNIAYLDASQQPVIPTNNLSNVSYVVYAGVSDHLTVYSPTNQSPDGLAPSTATGLTATAGTVSIALAWTAPTTNTDASALTDLLGYEVYRATSSSGPYVQINTTDVLTTSYTDGAVSSNITYYYKVTAADTGGIESAMSTATAGVQLQPVSTGGGSVSVPIATPTPTPTPTPSPSATPTPSPTATPTSTPALTPSPTVAPLALKEIPKLSAKPTLTEIQAAIAVVLNNIQVLQQELAKIKGQAVSAFVQDLNYGLMGHSQVKRLQGLLISKGFLQAGLDSGNYLSKTVSAVKAYQQAKGITPANGKFGPKTRAALNKDLGL